MMKTMPTSVRRVIDALKNCYIFHAADGADDAQVHDEYETSDERTLLRKGEASAGQGLG
jgi:hypothetical protein